MLNTAGIPVLFSGTPDGIGALTKRLSNLQRFATGGYHAFRFFEAWDDPSYRNTFLQQLGGYQYVRDKLRVDDELAKLVIELSGGVPRIIMALWMAIQRIALERESDDLRLSDFTAAAGSFLRPLAPAVAAIRSKDPYRLAHYEDMQSRDPTFWPSFWREISSC